MTLQRMEKVWMRNLAENLSTIRKAHNISEIPKQPGRSAIVLGAGPSTKYVDLSLLKDWKGVLISCDRQLPKLLEMGIEPYCVTTVDGSELIADFYKAPLVQEHAKNFRVVLSCQTTHPSVSAALPLESQYYFVGLWDDPFALFSITRIFQELTDKMILETGGNTGSCAFYLAYFLGCNPIGLLGIDFAYDTLNHTQTIYYETFKAIAGNDPKRMLSFYRKGLSSAGKPLLTDEMFLTYYNNLMPSLQQVHNKIKVYNLGEYSLLPAEVAEPIGFEEYLKRMQA